MLTIKLLSVKAAKREGEGRRMWCNTLWNSLGRLTASMHIHTYHNCGQLSKGAQHTLISIRTPRNG